MATDRRGGLGIALTDVMSVIPRSLLFYLGLASMVLGLSACGKKDEGTPAPAAGGDGAGPGSASGSGILAYQESVRAGMDNLNLTMSFLGDDGERQNWTGRLTMVKDRFATVEHSTGERKQFDLRKWANVHIVEIPSSGEPRVNRTEDSPLTGRTLIADRLDTGGWRHGFDNEAMAQQSGEAGQKLLEELDRVEEGVAAFYRGQTLKVGESWQVPATALVRWFGDEVEGFTGDINVRVERMDADQGRDCVVMSVSVAATGKMRDPDGQALDLKMDGEGEIWRATELGEDLKVDIRGSVTLSASVAERDIQMIISGPLVIAEERKLRE